MTIDADYVDSILAEAREYATGFARIPGEELVVALVTTAGPAGRWPVVRFMADPAWLAQLIETYDAEAEGEVRNLR